MLSQKHYQSVPDICNDLSIYKIIESRIHCSLQDGSGSMDFDEFCEMMMTKPESGDD